MAGKHGINPDDAQLFLHGTAEEMEAQASALAQRNGTTSRKAEDRNQGLATHTGTKAAACT
ncbi:hypothetical protein F8390_01670 [Corynebacterium sp. 366]|uniref:hypothetical protein n=1 Tax=unclassified Corynebacterium TaxID=2624378 RepID=UPI00130137E9|nr:MULTISPECIES: hypothetical protein [unclassified Corynebacterium]KAB3539998.1 hypothetical protein F8390_01670 [Corynebacterium sp. 366]